MKTALTHDERREMVMDYMHFNGKHRDELSGDDWVEVYLLGDGFGPLDFGAADLMVEWDWSHVRDSSVEAIRNMYEHLQLILSAR